VDPNRLWSDPDPDPGSHVHSDPAPVSEQDPNKFGSRSGSDLNLSNFLIIKVLIVVKMIFLVLKFSYQVILKSIYIYLETKVKF